MSNFDKETFEAMLAQKDLVIDGCLAALRIARDRLARGSRTLEVTTLLSTEIREIENLRRSGRRNPANTLAVQR